MDILLYRSNDKRNGGQLALGLALGPLRHLVEEEVDDDLLQKLLKIQTPKHPSLHKKDSSILITQRTKPSLT